MKALRTQPGELPLLAAIGGMLRWLEELLVMASGPVLTFGLGVGLVTLLTDGQLLVSAPWLLYAWGIAMAVGVDGQLVGAAVKAGRAFRAHRWWHTVGYCAIIAALSYVAYLAAIVFATSQAQGISTTAALHLLGMDDTAWITQRSAVAVVLVILSGALRYDPVKPVAETSAERDERMGRELQEAQHKAALRAAQWSGLGSAIRGGIDAAKAGVGATDTDGNSPGDPTGNPPDNEGANTGQDGDDSEADSEGNGIPLSGRKHLAPLRMSRGRAPLRGRITADELVTWMRDTLGVEIRRDDALHFVKSMPGSGPTKGVPGSPVSAPKPITLQRAKAKWGTAPATQVIGA